jgi:hypothetical protein
LDAPLRDRLTRFVKEEKTAISAPAWVHPPKSSASKFTNLSAITPKPKQTHKRSKWQRWWSRRPSNLAEPLPATVETLERLRLVSVVLITFTDASVMKVLLTSNSRNRFRNHRALQQTANDVRKNRWWKKGKFSTNCCAPKACVR